MKKVYIAGPYTHGNVISNIRDAIEAGDWLMEMGYCPFIPHLTGFWDMMYPHDWMSYDAEWLRACDMVLRLPGESPGAERECRMAEDLSIPVYYSIEELMSAQGVRCDGGV